MMIRKILQGFLVYFIGHLLVIIHVSIYNDNSDRSIYRALVTAILYLAAIVYISQSRKSSG